jgi:diadenosine tetraphosphate (Ap4A) HIT family hydrolase
MNTHPRILADSIAVCTTGNADIRLMNDSRWPWLILIPTQSDIEELHDLTHTQRDLFMADVNQVSRVMQLVTRCRSVNIAMLGNVVSQLHCHVVARDEGDANWPRPVWGYANAVAYDGNEPQVLMAAITRSFS